MAKSRKETPAKSTRGPTVDTSIFWIVCALLSLVPLALSTSVYTKYSLPKFVVLLVGSSLLVLSLALRATRFRTATDPVLLRSRLTKIVCLYFGAVTVSTVFGVAPIASVFGSQFSFMGLITRLCFLIVFIALISAIGPSEKRLRVTLWVIACSGFLVAVYAVAQSFGIEPFVSKSLYTFATPEGPVVRVSSTLGHSNYLGNFLLYTTPISVGLALSGRGWLRLFAIAGAALSLGAIVFSGTRGAWIGIVAGAVTFTLFELKSRATSIVSGRRMPLAIAAISAILLISIIVISPASHSVGERMRALIKEGTSSSGRMLLWRDSLAMVPAFPLVGCGPEGFRKALLGFKSKELAWISPTANNESPHSAYLEAAISHGLVGAVLYVAMIVLALRILFRARLQIREPGWRLPVTGLVSSFIGALVHNIFIFDQIATGLYFFAFIALTQATSNVANGIEMNAREKKTARPSVRQATTQWKWTWSSRAPVAAGCLLVVGSVWYSAGLVRSELAYMELFDPINPVQFDELVQVGERITSSPLPTGYYNFAFARAVDSFIRKLPASTSTEVQSSGVDIDAIRARAARLAIEHVEKSLAHTLTPDLNYSLLGSLALVSGDVHKLRYAASQAVRWDPNNYYTRWLMAEAYLVSGENELAMREARLALELNPFSTEAASALARARGPVDDSAAAAIKARMRKTTIQPKRSVEALIEMGRALAEAGLLEKAQNKLLTAIRRAGGPCADCHRELATIYEQMGQYQNAIAEWEAFCEQAPGSDVIDQIKARIEMLRRNSDSKP